MESLESKPLEEEKKVPSNDIREIRTLR